MGWWRKLLCLPCLDLHAEALYTWDHYKQNPEDHSYLDRCIKCWRKLLKKTRRNQIDRNDRDQALQYLAKSLLAKYQSTTDEQCRLKMLNEAAALAPELCEETSKVAPDHVYDILVNLADAFFGSAFQGSGNGAADSHLLESSLDWYRKANTLEFAQRMARPQRIRLCSARCADLPKQEDEQRPTPPQATSNDPVNTVDLLVQLFNLSHGIAALDKAIELLKQLATSPTLRSANESQIAEVWANHARLLLGRALCRASNPADTADDLLKAVESSEKAIQLAGDGAGQVFAHAHATMVLATYHRLSACRDSINLAEVDGILENLAGALAYEELAQNLVMLVTLANAVNVRRQRFDKEPSENTTTLGVALCARALKICQNEDVRAIIFQSRYHLCALSDDLEQAMQCYTRAAMDPNASREEKQSREDKARILGECLRALVEPDSPAVPVSIPFVEIPKPVCDAIMIK